MGKRRAFLLSILPISANCFADTGLSILAPNTIVQNACVFENTGVYQGTFMMVPVYKDTLYECERGYYLPKESETCTLCLADAYCPGGQYSYSITEDTGIFVCPVGTYAPAGMWEADQCGRIFHVGGAKLYLRSTKVTTPSLHFDFDGDGVPDMFASMTVEDVPMNKDTDQRLKVRQDGIVYSVYDDTVQVPEKATEETTQEVTEEVTEE